MATFYIIISIYVVWVRRVICLSAGEKMQLYFREQL